MDKFTNIINKIKDVAVAISPYVDLQYHIPDDIKNKLKDLSFDNYIKIYNDVIIIKFTKYGAWGSEWEDEIELSYEDIDNPIEITIEKYKNIQLKEQESKRLAEDVRIEEYNRKEEIKNSEEYKNYLELKEKYASIS